MSILIKDTQEQVWAGREEEAQDLMALKQHRAEPVPGEEIASCRVQGSLTGERANWKVLSLRKKKSVSPPDVFCLAPGK